MGGKPPSYCDGCKKRGGALDIEGTDRRRTALSATRKVSSKLRSPAVEDLAKASLLAQGLSHFPDPRDAALSSGFEPDPVELERLTQRAKELYPELIAGRVEGIASLATRAIHHTIQRYLDQVHLVAPRDLPFAAQSLANTRKTLIGDLGARHGWTEIEIVIPRVATEADRPCLVVAS